MSPATGLLRSGKGAVVPLNLLLAHGGLDTQNGRHDLNNPVIQSFELAHFPVG